MPSSRRDVLKTTAGGLGAAGFAGSAAGANTVEFNIGFRTDAGRAAAVRVAAEVEREFAFDANTIRVAPEAVENLASNPNVKYVEENGTMVALEQTTPYGIDITNADVAIHNGNAGGAGVDIAVIDTFAIIDDSNPT